ncbi:deleted in malignant brain tumors 1 protein-like [Lucilia sericata]|uniref:deleted in malignant brain tumors 1 protein-like n=1 Tax=Lucilia sericata TaxID=13632 RepID=UPI0018A881F5|nr:deleted in malignant brain tumors 1 protein-like [Lucilia sericata]
MSNIGSYANISSTATTTIMNIDDLPPYEFIYSSGKIFALRLRFAKPLPPKIDNWHLNVSVEYRFLKKDNFKNDGRLIPGTYCDYYFFANPEVPPNSLDIWKYFHSPRFPAKYPSHIKCSYKFIGRPETRVEVIFEELRIPRKGTSCNLDKLTIFDAESANMNAVIDVLCGMLTTTRHILSTGPDLLIEFNASSNITSKGFRGKFKFIQNDFINSIATDSPIVVGEIHTSLKKPNNNILAFNIMENSKLSKGLKEAQSSSSSSSSPLLATLTSTYTSYSALEDVTQNPLCLFTNIFTIQNNTVKIINSSNNRKFSVSVLIF